MYRRRWSAVIAAGALAASLSADPPVSQDLLRQSDISRLAPESFRARLLVTGRDKPLSLEVWRSGDEKLLVRFLGPGEEGKYLLRLGRTLYFLSPRAKKPVKLDPAYRLSGAAALDEILGTRYSREYDVVGEEAVVGDDGALVAFDLAARTEEAPFPRVRYVVSRATRKPVRAELGLSNGKTTRIVEFLEWQGSPRAHPRRLRMRDVLDAKASAEVEILEVEERAVPDGLFDLSDPRARRGLEEREPAPHGGAGAR
jgi:Outer membrane lipoprotein-sorting protein